MKYLIIFSFFISQLFFSCAHQREDRKDEFLQNTLGEEVSIETLLMHAHAAYLRGCLKEKHRKGQKGDFKICKSLADEYLKSEIFPFITKEYNDD